MLEHRLFNINIFTTIVLLLLQILENMALSNKNHPR